MSTTTRKLFARPCLEPRSRRHCFETLHDRCDLRLAVDGSVPSGECLGTVGVGRVTGYTFEAGCGEGGMMRRDPNPGVKTFDVAGNDLLLAAERYNEQGLTRQQET